MKEIDKYELVGLWVNARWRIPEEKKTYHVMRGLVLDVCSQEEIEHHRFIWPDFFWCEWSVNPNVVRQVEMRTPKINGEIALDLLKKERLREKAKEPERFSPMVKHIAPRVQTDAEKLFEELRNENGQPKEDVHSFSGSLMNDESIKRKAAQLKKSFDHVEKSFDDAASSTEEPTHFNGFYPVETPDAVEEFWQQEEKKTKPIRKSGFESRANIQHLSFSEEECQQILNKLGYKCLPPKSIGTRGHPFTSWKYFLFRVFREKYPSKEHHSKLIADGIIDRYPFHGKSNPGSGRKPETRRSNIAKSLSVLLKHAGLTLMSAEEFYQQQKNQNDELSNSAHGSGAENVEADKEKEIDIIFEEDFQSPSAANFDEPTKYTFIGSEEDSGSDDEDDDGFDDETLF